MFGNALWFVVLFAVLYWLPGRLFLQFLKGDPVPEESFPVSAALGLVAVNTLAVMTAGILGLVSPFELGFGLVALSSAFVSLLLLGLLRWRRIPPFRGWLRRPSRRLIGLWLLTVGATTVFFVHYDRDCFWEEACMVRAAMGVNARTLREDLISLYNGGEPLSVYQSDPIKGEAPDRNLFLTQNKGQRVGPTVILSPLLAVYGSFGFRVAYALQGLLLPGLGFLLGWYVFRRPWAAFLVAVLLTFSPYALAQRTFDENFLSSSFGVLALVMLIRPSRAPFFAGMALGLYFGIRESCLLTLPFVLWYLWRSSDRPGRDVGRLMAGVVLFALPTIAVHVLFLAMHGGTLLFQSYEHPPTPHSLFGVPLDLPAVLNWPFVDEPQRSPYMAYPPLVAYPLDFLRRFGLVLVALIPAGLAWLFGRDRRRALLLVAWTLPLLLVVAVQSKWIEPNKMGIPATVLGPIVLTVVAGLVYLVDRAGSWKRRVVWAVVGLALPLAVAPALRAVDAPRDARVHDFPYTMYAKLFPPSVVLYEKETPAYVAWDRERYEIPALPTFTASDWDPAMIGRGASQFADNLRNPSFTKHERSIPDYLEQIFLGSHLMIGPVSLHQVMERGGVEQGLAPVPFFRNKAVGDGRYRTLALDLNEPPLLAQTPAVLRDHGDVVAVDENDVTLLQGFRVSWSEHPQNLLMARDRYGTVTLLLMSGEPGWFAQPEWMKMARIDADRFPDNRVPLSLPEDEIIRLYEVRSFRPARWYVRTLRIEDGKLKITHGSPMSPS